MIVRGEQRAALVDLVQMLDRSPRNRKTIPGRSTASDFVENDDRSRRRLIEDRRRLKVAADGSLLPAPLTGSDEARNTDTSGRLFVSRSLSENPGAPGGAFDDRVSWISPNLIAHRLIGAGRLP